MLPWNQTHSRNEKRSCPKLEKKRTRVFNRRHILKRFRVEKHLISIWSIFKWRQSKVILMMSPPFFLRFELESIMQKRTESKNSSNIYRLINLNFFYQRSDVGCVIRCLNSKKNVKRNFVSIQCWKTPFTHYPDLKNKFKTCLIDSWNDIL